ncbi:MAG: DUF364 domain-containing protein [Planctomycetes bacterium]|nr:DUF364 domain-containing protein [Planctomycetota bacterium]
MSTNREYRAAAHANARPVVEMLSSHLMAVAGQRAIRQAVAGARFCAVTLDDGSTGVANLCPDVCGEPSRRASERSPRPGTPAADALATLASPTRSAVGLATANALANRLDRWSGRRDAGITEGDLLEVLELRPDDQVGMIGCFSPLVEPIGRRVRRLLIFERGQRLTPELLPENQAHELLPQCSVAIITATTLLNGTIDALLAATVNCREVVLLGPSTPLVPRVFAKSPRQVTLLAGVVVTNVEELLRTVARDGGTRDFLPSVVKVNVRVPGIGAGPPGAEASDGHRASRPF